MKDIHPEMKAPTKYLLQLCSRHGVGAFQDWLEVFYNFLHIPDEKRDKIGLRISKIYKDEVKLFYEMIYMVLEIAANEIENRGWYDPMGNIFESVILGNFSKKSGGIYFTPPPICEFMAQITVPEEDFAHTFNREVKLMDPASGSARMLLAAKKQETRAYQKLNDEQKKEWVDNLYFAIDINHTCFLMSTINCYLHGAKGQIARGNSLDFVNNNWSCAEILKIPVFDLAKIFIPRPKATDDMLKDMLSLKEWGETISQFCQAFPMPYFQAIVTIRDDEYNYILQADIADRAVWKAMKAAEHEKIQLSKLKQDFKGSLFEEIVKEDPKSLLPEKAKKVVKDHTKKSKIEKPGSDIYEQQTLF